MTIAYNYKVISTDYGNKVMEILYTAEGYPDQLISAPMPVNNQNELDIVKAYAPIAYWQSLKAEVVQVQVGSTGHVPVPAQEEIASNGPRIIAVERVRV